MRLKHHKEPATNMYVWTLEMTEKEVIEIQMTETDREIIRSLEFNIPEALMILSFMSHQVELNQTLREREQRHEQAQADYHQRQLRNPQST